MKRIYNRSTSLLVISTLMLFVESVNADSWAFEIEPYVMSTTIEGDSSIGRVNGAEVEVDMSDILEVLHTAGMLHFEALHDSGWGVALDYSFMDLRDDISGPRGGVTDVKVRQGVLQADLIYRKVLGNSTLDYLAGIRWWDNDLEVSINPAVLPGSLDVEVKEDWVDVFVGARWQTEINDQWGFMVRGDVGGFDLESDFTSSISSGFKYTINDKFILDMQYKATWVDYEGGNKGERGYFEYDAVTHGPLVGVIYKLN